MDLAAGRKSLGDVIEPKRLDVAQPHVAFPFSNVHPVPPVSTPLAISPGRSLTRLARVLPATPVTASSRKVTITGSSPSHSPVSLSTESPAEAPQSLGLRTFVAETVQPHAHTRSLLHNPQGPSNTPPAW